MISRLLKARKYLSYFVVAIVFFILGIITMYLFNLNWILTSKYNVERIVSNSRETYEIQNKLIDNYKRSFEQLYICIMAAKDECDPNKTSQKFQNIYNERQQLTTQLNALNKETESIIGKFPQTN